jgi:hypothetical protein
MRSSDAAGFLPQSRSPGDNRQMNNKPLARMTADRRRHRRRAHDVPVLAAQHVFQRDERAVLKALDRRRAVRRDDDVRERVAGLEA